MSDLLFLSQRIPFPPNKGDKIRSFHVLKHLSKTFRIHLGCFIDDETDWRYVEEVRGFCTDSCFVRLKPRLARLRCLAGMVAGEALTLPYFRDDGLTRWVRGKLAVQPMPSFIFSSAMAQYVMNGTRPGRIVMDFGDVDSDKWRQYAATQSWPMNWLFRRESRTLLAFDRAAARVADASIFVSEPEAELFRHLAPESSAKTVAIANGIDTGYFQPDSFLPRLLDGDGPLLTFTGAMDYWPNADAVAWFAERMLPRLRQSHPTATFAIVGSNPSPSVKRLAERPGVVVTGRVEDVRPYVAHADCVVVPIRIARGIQNKVLEGMAMGRPVVVTPQALEGISAQPGRDLILADDEDTFVAAVERLLADRPAAEALGQAARRRVEEVYDWSDKLAHYERLISG